jgi:hypothetical protein
VPVLARAVVGAVPVSKRRGELRHTRDGERRDKLDIRQQGGPGMSCRSQGRPSQTRPILKAEVAGLWNEKVTETSGNMITQLTADVGQANGINFRFIEHWME